MARLSLRRLLYCVIRASRIERWNEQRAAHGLLLWDSTQIYHLRGIPDETVGIEVDTAATSERLVRAIRAHQSQWSYQAALTDDRALRASLSAESWQIARPATNHEVALADIFEGF